MAHGRCKPRPSVADANLSNCNSLASFPRPGCRSLGSSVPHRPPWPSLSLPFRAPAAPLQPERPGCLCRRGRGHACPVGSVHSPFSHSFPFPPIVSLFRWSRVSVKMYRQTWKPKLRGRGMRPSECTGVARGFPRAYVGRPETLTPRDLKGEEPLAQEFFLGVSLTVSSDRL